MRRYAGRCRRPIRLSLIRTATSISLGPAHPTRRFIPQLQPAQSRASIAGNARAARDAARNLRPKGHTARQGRGAGEIPAGVSWQSSPIRKHRSPEGETVLSGGERSQVFRLIGRSISSGMIPRFSPPGSSRPKRTPTIQHYRPISMPTFGPPANYSTTPILKVSTLHLILPDIPAESTLRKPTSFTIHTAFTET